MEELGHLRGEEKNRYWEIKLSKFKLLSSKFHWFYKLCWRTLTFLMVIPLFLIAKYYSAKLRLNNKKKGEDVLVPYQYFTDIYPGCVYSPFIKGYELELFRNCDLNEPILEIGIGDGYFSSLLFKLKNKKLTYGADLIYETIKSATKYSHCENYLLMDASEIPFPDSCMGTVIMNNLMHHLPNRSAILNEVLRVLKKGGKFIFTDCKIGWGIFTWEQILLRKLNLHRLAESMLRFKLQLSAQRLLIDDCYYDKKSKSRNFRILKKINFISRTSMYLGSVFEFLNLKMGQPTREEMVRWINFFGLEGKISRYVKNIIEYCCIMDKRLGEKEGYTIQFIKIEKLRENELNMGYNSGPIAYVCPKCKKSLAKTNDSFFCSHCDSNFPIIDGIPILISYQDKLRGFASYIERTGREKTKEYVT